MPGPIDSFLAAWLASETPKRIGEVAARKQGGSYRLHHYSLDAPETTVATHRRATDARTLAKYDATGDFRPLKSAPNLVGGWLLELTSIREVREALDYFYPAAVSNWIRKSTDDGSIIPLRDTLDRQTGMYRVTGLIRDDEAQRLVSKECASEKCQRKILWELSNSIPLSLPNEKRTPSPQKTGDPNIQEVPLVCCEACNLLVAAARKAVKTRMSQESQK